MRLLQFGMSKHLSIRGALSRLVSAALSGEEVVIAKAGKPLVCLVPYHDRHPVKRHPGTGVGKFSMTDDFDAPLPDEELRAGGEQCTTTGSRTVVRGE